MKFTQLIVNHVSVLSDSSESMVLVINARVTKYTTPALKHALNLFDQFVASMNTGISVVVSVNTAL